MNSLADPLPRNLLDLAIALAVDNAHDRKAPFAAVIETKSTLYFPTPANTDIDPTGHAEMSAIRHAARVLRTNELRGSVLYTSCEPCAMCVAAAEWARLDRIVYAATRAGAIAAGYDQPLFVADAARHSLSSGSVLLEQRSRPRSLEPFTVWVTA